MVSAVAGLLNLECRAYYTGTDFLAELRPADTGCVLLELRLPDMHGLAILRHLAESRAAPPAILVSGEASVSIGVDSIRRGALHFLEKPLDQTELIGAIREAVAVGRQRRCDCQKAEQFHARLASLTSADQRLLQQLLAGKPNRACATEAGITLRAVEARRARLMKKIGVGTYDELILLFARAGMVSPAKRAASRQSHRTTSAPPVRGPSIHSPASRNYRA